MSDYGATFKYGGVVYPITSSTTNSLLQDADPALYYALNFCASVLTTHIQPRLLAETARSPAMTTITAAVKMALPWDPAPFLTDAQIQFPLLAMYRKTEKNVWKVQSYMDDVSEWGIQYVLPPITAGQADRVMPILRAVSRVLMNRIENKMDDGYLSGADVWALAQLEEIYLESGLYDAYEGTKSNMIFPVWVGKLIVKERDMPFTATQFAVLGGLDNETDVVPSDGTATLADVVDSQLTFFDPNAPTLTFYADVPASITATSGAVSAWSIATASSGTPLVAVDSVAGGNVVRTRTSDKLLTAAGAASFINSAPCTIIFVWRYRTNGTGGIVPLLDLTELGTKAGLQIQIGDQGNNIFYGRSISVRQWDGASWSWDSQSNVISSGAFIPLKQQVVAIRLTSTNIDIRVDGQAVNTPSGSAIVRAYLANTTGKLAIGGAASDYKAIELYNQRLDDTATTAAEKRLAQRFGVNLSVPFEGDQTYTNRLLSASFPYLSKLPNGLLYATSYNGIDGPASTDHNDAFTSSDGGKTWIGPIVLTSSGSGTLYSDIKTSEPLSDGSILQVTMTYNVGLAFVNVIIRKSTDSGSTWSAWSNILTGSPAWSATQCPPFEDPTQPGHLHMAVFTQEGVNDVYQSVWDYQSTDGGNTWSRVRIANGMTDSKKYVEPGFWFLPSGELRCLIRDNTVNGTTPMLMSRSTDHGVTWATVTTVNLAAWSSGQEVRRLASGREVWIGRQMGSSQKGALFWRAAGAAWNAAWSSNKLEIDPLFGGMYYAGIYETTPGNLCLVMCRSGGAGHNNVNASYQLPEWELDFAMPGIVTPSTFALTINTTKQIVVTGAGDFTYAITVNNSAGSVNSAGLYTAGAANGVDTVTVTDLNGYIVGTALMTVSGASSVPSVASIAPNVGTAAGGTAFTISGGAFTGATSVTIAGTAVTSFTVVNNTTITGVAAAHAAVAAADVVVTSPGGSGTLTGGYNYLPAGYKLHLRGDLGLTLSGSNVLAWADQSGTGNHVTPPAFNPTTATGINGKPTLHFVGSDHLTFASFTAGLTALEIFCVAKNIDDGLSRVAAFCFTDDTQGNLMPFEVDRKLYDGSGSTTRQTTNFAPATGGWSSAWLYNAIGTASEWTANFNGNQIYTQASNTFGYGTKAIGKGVMNAHQGDIGEVLLWPAKLTTGDRAVVTAYLKTRYNIP